MFSTVSQARDADSTAPLWLLVLQASYLWVIFALLTPGVIAAQRRMRPGRLPARRWIAGHLLFGLLFALVVHRGTVQFAILPSDRAIIIGVPWSQFTDGDAVSVIGAVGSNQMWNDDLQDEGLVTIRR